MSTISSINYTSIYIFLIRKTAEPGLGCLNTIISTFIANILFTVSKRVSPFFNDELDDEKFIISMKAFSQLTQKESFVLVEFSKNKFAIVISLSDGTFLIG